MHGTSVHQDPVKPGEKGSLTVTYNGRGRFPGHFKKTITVRTNGDPAMLRLYIEGTMTEAEKNKAKGTPPTAYRLAQDILRQFFIVLTVGREPPKRYF